MLADLTFTVELSSLEAELLGQVLDGKTDEEIVASFAARRRRYIRQVLAGLRLDLDLIEATRAGQITWRLEASPASFRDRTGSP